ncbi:MAG: deoxyribose-phosphate aldolase [Bacteroidetes bacterium]|nr:MAG: deoxyribose-phosphate aldolase [Bacteroidota bacterium]TAG89860.1 MAG: deoxyribose-phosphate aldolase [Bacteroidota bacterium]
MINFDSKIILKSIEHTNLQPTLVSSDVEKLVEEAKLYQFGGVCVPPYWAKKARRDLGYNIDIQLVTVIGFPLGYQRSEVKMQEVISAIKDGVNEFDMVVNVSAVKMQAWEWIKPEIAQIAQKVHEAEGLLKVILETAYLTDEEIIKLCHLCSDAGTDFVKTSTGFAPKGATMEGVKLMRTHTPTHVGIKASGGIRTLAQAKDFLNAGAERLGTSAGVQIFEELNTENI